MYGSYVALGDSFTEGLDDRPPGGRHRGWADLVALELAARTPGFRYANLAVRGKLLAQVVDEQVPVAEALRPDLMSFAAGTNDLLRRSCDTTVVARTAYDAIERLGASGATLIVFTGLDLSRRLTLAGRVRERLVTLNAAALHAARDVDAVLVDLWPERAFDDPRLWSEDRLHLNTEGHRRIAAAVLAALGSGDSDWRLPLAAVAAPAWMAARHADLVWTRRHLAPWVHRRVTGRSSGDALAPKRPELLPYP